VSYPKPEQFRSLLIAQNASTQLKIYATICAGFFVVVVYLFFSGGKNGNYRYRMFCWHRDYGSSVLFVYG
jgi:hypothetical protein